MGGTVSRKKRGEETEILKKGDKLGQRRDTLKMGGGGWNPLTNYGKVTRT